MTRPAFQRILLTGGGGFVGGHLARRLAEEFPEARWVTTLRSPTERTPPQWAAVCLDLTDSAATNALVEDVRPDLVVHLAAQSSVGNAATEKLNTWTANLGGTQALAAAIAAHAPKATMLFASSSEVYGASLNLGPADETTPLSPMNCYARSKVACEYVLADVLGPDNRLIVVRPFNHTGPGQSEAFVLPSFAAQIARIERGFAPPVLSAGALDMKRDFLDVRDVIAAYIRLLTTADLPPRLTVTVASGVSRSIGELLDGLRRQAEVSFDVVHPPERMRPAEVADARGNPALLQKLTAWSPTVPIGDMLTTLLQSWRDNYASAPGAR